MDFNEKYSRSVRHGDGSRCSGISHWDRDSNRGDSMKMETVKEKIRMVEQIQKMARRVITENGGHDIKFVPTSYEKEDNGNNNCLKNP